AKQKFRPTRRSGFSRVKAYMLYVEVLKKRCNAGGRTFCDAINNSRLEDSACLVVKNIGKPCAGKPHVWFDEGGLVNAVMEKLFRHR
ncbi:MAG: hypothetical protein J7K75_09895, partial [Desulfuromonas sp.]|nr:hypothetical protein [Desulfuromonas sp.]